MSVRSYHIRSAGIGQYSREGLKLFSPRTQNILYPGNLGRFIHAGDSIKSFMEDGITTDLYDITGIRLKQSRKSSLGHRSAASQAPGSGTQGTGVLRAQFLRVLDWTGF